MEPELPATSTQPAPSNPQVTVPLISKLKPVCHVIHEYEVLTIEFRAYFWMLGARSGRLDRGSTLPRLRRLLSKR